MYCSLKKTSRPALPLSGPGLRAVARDQGTHAVAHAIQTLRRLYPGLRMGLIDSSDPRHGWIDPSGRSVVNLRHAGLDTPFHEAGHLWEAVLENALPVNEYDAILQELAGTPYAERAIARYPDLNERDQLREALVQLLGEQAADKFRDMGAMPPGSGDGLRALGRRVWARVREALIPLLGPPTGTEGPLTARTLSDVLAQGVEALVSTPSPHLVPRLAAQLLRGTLDQRGATVPSLQHVGHLLERISGQDASVDGRHLDTEASSLLGKALKRQKEKGGKLYFEKDAQNGMGKARIYDIVGKTEDERKASILKHLTEIGQQHREQLTTDALDFFGRPEAERQKLLRGDFGNDLDIISQNEGRELDDEQREQRRLYYQEMQRLFPSFQQGDEIMLYTKAKAGDLYHPSVNAGGLLLHKKKTKDPATGADKVVLSLATLTDGPLGETTKHRSFLAGIYDSKGISGVFNNLMVRFGHEIKLSNTHENRQKLQVLLAGMHLRSLGYEVESLSVGKLDRMQSRRNQVMRFFPTEHLQVIEKLALLPQVREHLQASGENGQHLLKLLDDEKLRAADQYCGDYLQFLSQHYTEAGPAQDAIRSALGEYYTEKSASSLLSLDRAIRRRQRQLIRQSKFKDNPEFVMLGQAMVDLAGIKYHLNPWLVMDAATEKFTSFLRNDNPINQYFIKRWDDTWYNVSQRFMGMQDAHQKVTEDLHKEKGQQLGLGAVGENLVERDQSKYYEGLFQRETVEWLNPKTQELESREINSHKLILPTSPAFKNLLKSEQAYIRWALGAVKERVLAVEKVKREQNNESLKADEIEAWYQEKWGDGRIPVIQAGVWQSVLKGDVAYATEEHLRGLLEDNPRFHDQQQDGEDRLNDYILTQSDNKVRAKALGLEPDDQDSKKWQLRSQDGEQVQNRIEGDMRRVMNVFMMQTLKHEMQQDLEVDTKVGIALIRNHEHITGLLRHTGQVSVGNDGETTSQTEQGFLKMARQLWLNRTNQGMGHGLEKGLHTLLAAAGSLASTTILLGNIMVPVQSFLSQTLGTLLPQVLASTTDGVAPTAKHTAEAIKAVANQANWPMLEAMAQQLHVVRHGEFDLLGMRSHTGEPFRVFSGETFYSLDRWGDTALRMTIMVAMLKQQGIYQAYGWDATKKTLTYDVAADKRARGEKTVEAIRYNLVREGVLEEGQPLDRAYDGLLRRNLEMVLVDVMGGYSPLGQTVLGATAGGKMVKRLATFMPARIERAFQGRHKEHNRVKYEDGEVKNEESVGQAQSWVKMLTLMWGQSGNLLTRYRKVKGDPSALSAADLRNLRTINANLALYAMFAVAGYAVQSQMSDQEKRRKRTLALKLLDSMIAETFAFENFRMLLGKASSPVIELAMLKNLMDGVSNVIEPGGNASRGWHQMSSRVGALRSGGMLLDAVSGEEKK